MTTPTCSPPARTGLPWRGMPRALDPERRQPLGRALGARRGDLPRAEEAGAPRRSTSRGRPRSGCAPGSGRCRAGGSRPRGAACRGRRARRGRRRRRAARPRSPARPRGRSAARPRPRRCSRCRRRAPGGRRSRTAATRIRGGSSTSSVAGDDRAGVRALDGEHRVAVGDVADGDVVAAAPAPQPGEVGLVVGRVGDEQVAVAAEPVGEEVVDDPAAPRCTGTSTGRRRARSRRRRWRAPAAGSRAPPAPRPRPRPCGRRRTCPRASAPRRAPRGSPRRRPASPSPRTGPSSRRGPTCRS